MNRSICALSSLAVTVLACGGNISKANAQASPAPAPAAGASGAWWKPQPGTTWQIQLNGTPSTDVDAEVFDVDLYDTPPDWIDQLHKEGRKAICYFSAGTKEDWRQDAGNLPAEAVGHPLQGWPGERWLDIRSLGVLQVMQARLDLAVQKHCDGVDFDNVDGFTQDSGFNLLPADQLNYNRALADAAHQRGLAAGLKNDLRQVNDLVASFDWSLNEQCFQYQECDLLKPFITASKPVFNVEYGDQSLATTVCPQANADMFDTLVMPQALDGSYRIPCR